MAGDFTKQAATALKLIKAKGQPLAFSRSTTPFDPVLGGGSGAAEAVTYAGHGVRLPNYKGTVFDAMDNAFKAALVTGQAAILLVAAAGMAQVPVPGDDVALGDGSIWLIKGLTALNPAGQPILYTLGVVLK